MPDQLRWGILGTANIARSMFLPALRAAGGGTAHAVASRTRERVHEWATENGVERGLESYEALVADDSVDAVYIPLPNRLHAEWAIAALQAGKAVLCEKPLTDTREDSERLLEAARRSSAPLWEAFVFPFHRQMDRVREIISGGTLGDVHEVQSSFHFLVRRREGNIRFSSDLGGGALLDVGCYCIRLARLVFDADADSATAFAVWAPEGIDEEMQGILTFPGDRRLSFTCGMRGPQDTLSRVLGAEGEIRMTNPFHPGENDTLEVRAGGEPVSESTSNGVPSFTPAIRHIHAVLRREEVPRHLAVDDALGNSRAIDILLQSARQNGGMTTR